LSANDQQRENLNTLANILQQDASNNDLMQELQKQNEDIIARLERLESALKLLQR
jgi:hypothetical protein